MSVEKVEILAGLLRAQAESDTVWCQAHGLAGAGAVPASARILIRGGHTFDLCAACARARLVSPLPDDEGSMPLQQLAYIALAVDLAKALGIEGDVRLEPTSLLPANTPTAVAEFCSGGRSQAR